MNRLIFILPRKAKVSEKLPAPYGEMCSLGTDDSWVQIGRLYKCIFDPLICGIWLTP